MINKIINNKYFTHIITIISLFLSCLFMYNFYKCLSGFIANGFRYGIMMPTMFITYFTPVLAFLVYFYNYYVKELNKVTKWIYSVIIIALSIFNLVGTIINFDIYLYNNIHGVYQSIPSFILAFPFDGIVIDLFLIFVQIVNILHLLNKSNFLLNIKSNFNHQGDVIIHKFTYLIILVFAIFTFVFVGDFFCAFQAIENALYDPKYIFLMLWLFIIPLGNLLLVVLKPELRQISKKQKYVYLSLGLGLNLLFGGLLLLFETIYPSFMVDISKPLFPIAYSISIPIEVYIVIAIQIICSLIYIKRVIQLAVTK